MRPQFKPEFARGLCSSTRPADECLFGSDTVKRVKEMNELLNKLKVCRTSCTTTYWGRSQRYNPFPSQGRRDGYSFRGWVSCGRGFLSTAVN